MKNILKTLLFISAIALGSPTSFAGVSLQNQNESVAAYEALVVAIQQSQANGEMPLWANSKWTEMFDRFWNEELTLGTSPYIASDIPALIDVGVRANNILKSFVLFSPQADQQPDTAENSFKFQNEITRSSAYLMKTTVVQLEAITDFLETLPASELTETRQSGLRQMRLGNSELITGVIIMMRSEGLSSENRDILLTTLVDSADALSNSMPPVERASVMAQLDVALPSLAESEQIKAQMARSKFDLKECIGLCTIQ